MSPCLPLSLSNFSCGAAVFVFGVMVVAFFAMAAMGFHLPLDVAHERINLAIARKK